MGRERPAERIKKRASLPRPSSALRAGCYPIEPRMCDLSRSTIIW